MVLPSEGASDSAKRDRGSDNSDLCEVRNAARALGCDAQNNVRGEGKCRARAAAGAEHASGFAFSIRGKKAF